MAAAPFRVKSLTPPSLLQKTVGKKPKKNALVELSNLLAHAAQLTDVTPESIRAIDRSYGVDLTANFETEREDLYREYLSHCLADKAFTEAELANLAHLKVLLSLSDWKAHTIAREVGDSAWKQAAKTAISDGRLDAVEKEFLEKLQTQLALPDELATRIYAEEASAYLMRSLKAAIIDHRLSPEEDAEMESIAKSLGLARLSYDEETAAALDKFRLYWRIEQGDLPVVEAGVNLQRQETCHFAYAPVQWYEYRRVVERVQYAGFTSRIRIAKGLSFRLGDLAVRPIARDILTRLDTGRVILTNKRLIFRGERKNAALTFAKILELIPYRDAVEVHKASGKPFILTLEQGADVFALMFARLIGA